MRKLEFVIVRVASSVLVLLGVSVITFVLARIVPSNPAALYIGPRARPDEIARVAHELGLDRPLPVQYLRYMGDLLQGDLGNSISTKRPVLQEITTRLPATLELLLAGMALAILVGIPLGVFAARHAGGFRDVGARVLSVVAVSLPAFWLGLLLQIVFFRELDWLPLAGRVSTELRFTDPIRDVTGFLALDAMLTQNWVAFRDTVGHLVLPALTLAAFPAGLIARMTRASMLEALEEDYVRTARAYGLSERRIAFVDALKNAVGPTLSVIGLSFAFALTGSFYVEVIFNWPGLGQLTVRSLLNLDYPVVMGITLLGSAVYIVINLVVDLAQAWIDPRVSLT